MRVAGKIRLRSRGIGYLLRKGLVMAFVTRCAGVPLLACLVAIILPSPAHSALLQPLDGRGNFHSYVDVVNRWREDGRLDVIVLFSVATGDLSAKVEDRALVARLRAEVTLTGPDGRTITRKRPIRTQALVAREAASNSLRQVFGVLLTDVPFRSGRIECGVYDVNRRRPGLLNQFGHSDARSIAVGDWYAEEGARAALGLALDDPLYLFQAPLASWNPESAAEASETGGLLGDYVHPNRIYGLEQDRLQMVVPVWPPAGGTTRAEDLAGLRVQILSGDGLFAYNDSVGFDVRGRAALAAGRPAYLFYELDVNRLPEGSYQLSLAPLGGQGRAQVSGFSVVWRLAALTRHQDLVLGEGCLVFQGEQRQDFLDASPVEREAMLEDFWQRLNPDPTGPINPLHVEFQRRVAYVQQFYGGFGPQGPRDGRGEVFILLGPPDETQREPLPLNYRDQDDARIKVYDRFSPDRPGSTAKGAAPEGTQGSSPYESVGGIPLQSQVSRSAERDRLKMLYSAGQNFGFELWEYDNGGNPLFVNRLSNRGMGQRFLFVDRNGTGEYRIESSNIIQGDE
jgi:GWxTD domain-containing protein